ALAAHDDQLFVAEETSGRILVFDLSDGSPLGGVDGFHGPVTALALSRKGALAIKPGLGAEYLIAESNAVYSQSGQLVAGPLDAGENSGWHRVAVKGQTPPATELLLETFTSDLDHPGPGAWTPARGLDELLDESRYLW